MGGAGCSWLEAQVLPNVPPPSLEFFKHLAEVWPSASAYPDWGADFLPGRVFEEVFVITVEVVGIRVRGVVAENGSIRVSNDASVILAVADPDPGTPVPLHDVTGLLDVNKQVVFASEPVLDLDCGRTPVAISRNGYL